ncbi:MAG: YidC/Oxa1 family membrane protein insertase, partial [Armatimonadetes bacterium]|nr:YidC/Oxa1 family membrane protein insertase [Armatimonadota bacterium]
MFGALVDIITKILRFFHGLTGSYWLAIVVLTIFIKAILHPLTRKQLKSMKAMQVLAPKMEEIRRKFKDNPQEMNREVM